MINNIRYGENQKLNDTQRWQILQLAGNNAKLTIAQIKKKLKLLEEFNYEEESTLPCLNTSYQLKKHFANKVDLDDNKTTDDLWHLFYEAQDPDWLVNKLQTKYAFTEEDAKSVVKGKNRIRLEEGYGSLSALAIRRILPFLREGYRYDISVLLAGLCKVMGADFWDRLSVLEKETLVGNIKATSETRGKSTIRENLWNYIVAEYGVPEKATAADLYHHSDLDSQQDLLDALPEPKKLRNPIVEQALFEMRSLVNAMIKEYGRPDRMVLEMARELKNPKKKREEMLSNNRKREKQRNEIKQKLIDEGIRPTGYNITKLLLWEESKEQCPYTGRSIPRSELFDDGIWQIEHIVPYSVSLDDSFGNKTICHADENRRKGNKTPWQLYNFSEGLWAEVKERAKMIFCKGSYPKYLKFINEREPKADDFLSRQLNDTRYMATEAKAYLQKICSDVVVTPGGVTSELRHLWGLDGILSPSIQTEISYDGPGWLITENGGKILEFLPWSNALAQGNIEEKLSKKGVVWSGEMRKGVFYPGKNRDDHRHHAVDAIAIACTERRFVQAISASHSTGKWLKSEIFEAPWPSFFEDAQQSVGQILVSHKKRKRLLTTRVLKQKIKGVKVNHKLSTPRGQLHDETFYGKVLDPNMGTEVFTTRKPLSSITKVKQLRMITEPRILALIDARAQELGFDLDKRDAELPKNFFFEPDENGIPFPTLYLSGGTERASIPVKKVRVRVASSNMALRNESTQQYAEPGSNFLAAIIEDSTGAWREEVLSFWTAVKRSKNRETLISLNQGEKIRYLFQANDLYLLNWPNGINPESAPRELISEHLYRVQKFSSMFYVFRKHNASTLDYENEEIRIQSFPSLKSKNMIRCSCNNMGRLKFTAHE
jgi:CRISPR-associated endonuclease Csn1